MQEIQQQLADRYRALQDSRSGPVFFIEHGLSESEVEDLIDGVRTSAEEYTFDSSWWQAHSLPLIVAATEVGYRYRGTGTDFWPVLEQKLNSHLGGQERQRIRDLFSTAAKIFNGALPTVTPWSEAFHLIAWPIAHALVPIEFHRPLALTLANLRVNVSVLDDETLYRAIRVAADNSSARFSTLLENASLVVPIARSLLGEEVTELCHETIQRIASDIASDQVARRSVSAARRIQRVAPQNGSIRTEQPEPIPSVKGILQLRRLDGKIILEASFPRLEENLASRLRRTLRRRRYAPKLWGVTAPIPSEQLLSGLPFAIKFMSPPAVDAALLPRIEHLEIDDDLREILMAFDLELTTQFLFAIGADNEVGRRILGPNISGHRMYWVLAADTSFLAGFSSLGEVGHYTCYVLDPKDETACKALTDFGYIVKFGVSVAFSGAPPLDLGASTPSFAEGDQRVIVSRQSLPEGVLVELDGGTVRATGDEVIRLDVSSGEHLLRVSSGDETKEFPFKGVSKCGTKPVAACDIKTRSSELTVQALLCGRLVFSVESFAPLEGLNLYVEVEASGRKMSASSPLGPLPQIVSSEHDPFATLLDDSTRELLMQASSVTIHLRVGSLCMRSWELEHRVRRCWWNRKPDGSMVLMNELGELPFGAVATITPHLPPDSTLLASQLEASLLAPVKLDLSEYGGNTLFTTYCIAPSRTSFSLPKIKKPLLVRRRRGEHNAVGLEDLVESYLRWSLAETDSLIAEFRRRQVVSRLDGWIAELCCGDIWARREAELSYGDSWDLLVNICDETGLCRDSYVTLSRKDDLEIARFAVEEIRRVQPELFTRIGPICELSAEDYESLDLACGRAYSTLADQYLKRGRHDIAAELEEGDPGSPEEDWNAALERVKAHIEMTSLAELLLPSDTALRLMTLDPILMTMEELGDELISWARDTRNALSGSLPEDDTLRAILALWIEPEVAINLDWRKVIDTMISERSVSRATRYLALRCRQMKKGGVL